MRRGRNFNPLLLFLDTKVGNATPRVQFGTAKYCRLPI